MKDRWDGSDDTRGRQRSVSREDHKRRSGSSTSLRRARSRDRIQHRTSFTRLTFNLILIHCQINRTPHPQVLLHLHYTRHYGNDSNQYRCRALCSPAPLHCFLIRRLVVRTRVMTDASGLRMNMKPDLLDRGISLVPERHLRKLHLDLTQVPCRRRCRP
jgi:hypothetical protein